MTRTIATICVLAAQLCVFYTQIALAQEAGKTFEFKGVALRSSEVKFVRAMPIAECTPGNGHFDRLCIVDGFTSCLEPPVKGDPSCQPKPTYGGVPFHVARAGFAKNRLLSVRVELDASQFDHLVEVLVAGLGKPHARVHDTVTWRRGGDLVIAHRVKSMTVVDLVTAEGVELAKRAYDEPRKAAAKDL